MFGKIGFPIGMTQNSLSKYWYFIGTDKLNKDFRINASMDPSIKHAILTIIKDHWDSFRHMFDFELCIDTCDSKPFCCRHPSYVIHKRKIVDKHIHILETNDWICDFEGPWGSLILLAPKPH